MAPSGIGSRTVQVTFTPREGGATASFHIFHGESPTNIENNIEVREDYRPSGMSSGTENNINITSGFEIPWGCTTQKIQASITDGRLRFTNIAVSGGTLVDVHFQGGNEVVFKIRHDLRSSAIFVEYLI